MEAHYGGKFRGKGYPWPVYRDLWSARPEEEYTIDTLEQGWSQGVRKTGRMHYGPWHKNPRQRSYDPAHRASAVTVVWKGSKVLLLKRGPTDDWMPGRWCLPGGGIDPGEGPFEGALRELYEEAGLRLNLHDILPVDVIQMDTTTVYVFEAQAPGSSVRLLDGEHSEFRWVAPDAIHSFRTIPLVKPLLRSLSYDRSSSSSPRRAIRAKFSRR